MVSGTQVMAKGAITLLWRQYDQWGPFLVGCITLALAISRRGWGLT